jgi:alkanesulfonate monooxygenase SsuD/methylene tetrahydromethanopterin reductase-like flavin-dependent oxidoreductase (luciferase family)
LNSPAGSLVTAFESDDKSSHSKFAPKRGDMNIGIGLPSTIPGATGEMIVTWARRADEARFSSVGVLDRVAYDSFEPMTVLAAAASVTERVRLVTMILISPLRNTALLAKQAASLDALSGGRLTLGVAIGAREDDYDATGADHRTRGKRLDEQLAALPMIWEENVIGPKPVQARGPELLIGGSSDVVFARVARYADGYAHGGGPPKAFASAARKARAAWIDAGRPGQPRLWGQGYFALGDAEAGANYLRHYYAFTGPFAEKIAAGLLTTPQAILQFIRGYEEEGCDELVLFPTVASLDQLERLAEILK